MLSIIIPTLNEEDYLPKLLESIKSQSFKDYELIVADAGSKDATLVFSREHNCKVVGGGLPARGRNNGARAANGNILFFIDADTVLPDNFFENAYEEFEKRKLDIGSFCLSPLPYSKKSAIFLDIFYNYPIVLLGDALPHAAVGILIKKDVFEKLGGFDENIKLAEDHSLARKAKKMLNVKYGIIESTKIFVSDRRFRKDGWLTTGAKYFLCELHLMFLGPVKSDIFKYKFNHYKDSKKF